MNVVLPSCASASLPSSKDSVMCVCVHWWGMLSWGFAPPNGCLGDGQGKEQGRSSPEEWRQRTFGDNASSSLRNNKNNNNNNCYWYYYLFGVGLWGNHSIARQVASEQGGSGSFRRKVVMWLQSCRAVCVGQNCALCSLFLSPAFCLWPMLLTLCPSFPFCHHFTGWPWAKAVLNDSVSFFYQMPR